jgi:hypothetical protein
MKIKIILFSLVLFLICNIIDGFPILENAAICLSVYFFLEFLENLGKKIVIMDMAVIMAALTCLVMPVVFYHEYGLDNPLAKLWKRTMPVPTDEYFTFAIPAVVAMYIGIHFPLGKLTINKNPRAYMDNVKESLRNKPTVGLTLITIGIISGLLDFLSPESLKQFFYLIDHLTFVGVFYVIYSPNKYKKIIVPGIIAITVGQSLITGMFGEFVYILACALVLMMLGSKFSFYKKILVSAAGILFILIIQSVKPDYRKRIWQEGSSASPIYFAQLIGERITSPTTMLDADKLFVVATRMNQGWLIATTMKRVPAKYDFAYGETIWQSIAAAIVPRFLWPDKPESGGKANLKRFWGYNLVGYSMNIGPLGEGYANFNVGGGIIFMFFYGLFFNVMLSVILKLSEKRYTIVLWIPFLFFYAIGIETDLLTTMGSLVKGVFFTWIVFRAFRIAFRKDL